NEINEIIENFALINAGDFDVCILATSSRKIVCKKGIHVWIKSTDEYNANLMIMLSFIISGHPDWKKADFKIFDICKPEQYDETVKNNQKLINEGRLPITEKNIEIIIEQQDLPAKKLYQTNRRMQPLQLSDSGVSLSDITVKQFSRDMMKWVQFCL
ncbi:MAG: hypothetical protein K8R35_06730, partial [Bacteroidales bacterium]|nr:hypothetical protein [Bacteroidales bacterium]